MMLNLFKKNETLNEDTSEWIFDSFAWALQNFDQRVFFDETILVIPSNKHFPGRVDSIEGMASLIFEQVKEYAGMKHWPCRLLDQNQAATAAPTMKVLINGNIRGNREIEPDAVADEHKLLIAYNSHQLNNPEAMIASYAHTLAHYLGSMAQQPPPGGEELWPQTTEVLAVFMGFGTMFANSASVFRGGCGSCHNPLAERTAFLSQDEITYALALFCVLKEIPNKAALPHLKKHLRSSFKSAVKEIQQKNIELDRLRAVK
ncbi:hypothetical protein MNBD_GAMMA25-1653 [hydrothermal vent metagenome]|uniref:Uncharacterized protein n=1 Tax=hydrothermal vent metagenome TaxID=652676 RepID=A0A3B1BXR0_9ZZZZ